MALRQAVASAAVGRKAGRGRHRLGASPCPHRSCSPVPSRLRRDVRADPGGPCGPPPSTPSTPAWTPRVPLRDHRGEGWQPRDSTSYWGCECRHAHQRGRRFLPSAPRRRGTARTSGRAQVCPRPPRSSPRARACRAPRRRAVRAGSPSARGSAQPGVRRPHHLAARGGTAPVRRRIGRCRLARGLAPRGTGDVHP
jgi:hypothetical protein